MSAAIAAPLNIATATDAIQLATFYVGDLLLGLRIDQVQEINRRLDVTGVPHAPESIRGVINLRGEVVTVVDLRTLLELGPGETTRQSRNLIVSCDGEMIGLCVDRIADIVSVHQGDIEPTPPNVSDVDSKHFQGVVTLKDEIVVVLKLDSLLDF